MSLKNHPKVLYLPAGLCFNSMFCMTMSFATCNQFYQQQYKQYQYLSGISSNGSIISYEVKDAVTSRTRKLLSDSMSEDITY